jgi:hypothetical protein
MSGDPAKQTVALRLLNVHNYLLTFTDEPQPAEPPANTGSAAERNNAKWLSNIVGAMFKALGRPADGTGGSDEAKRDATNRGKDGVKGDAKNEAEADRPGNK